MTSAAGKGLVDIHDRRPLALSPEAARESMRQDVGGKEAKRLPPTVRYQPTNLSGTPLRAPWVM